MQTTFFDEMKIWAMRFTLQLNGRNIRDNRYDKVTDSSKLI